MKNIKAARQNCHFVTKVIVWLAKFPLFEEYPMKHRKIQLYKIRRLTLRDQRHKRRHSTESRLMQKYVIAYTSIFTAFSY
jgi:hypothetical protein